MEEALVVVKVLAGDISHAISLAKGPAFLTEVKPPPLAHVLASSPPSPGLSTSPSPSTSPSNSRAGGGGSSPGEQPSFMQSSLLAHSRVGEMEQDWVYPLEGDEQRPLRALAPVVEA